MATRSNIAIRVKEEDFEKVNNMIAEKGGSYKVSNENPYLQIYCHWDGYPDGVGADLRHDFNDYETALNMIIEGDHSTVYESYVSRGEDYISDQPKSVRMPYVAEEYLYTFENDRWTCETCYDEEVDVENYNKE